MSIVRWGRLQRESALWAVSSASNHCAVFFSRTCFSLSRRAELAQSFSGQSKACPTKSCARKRTGRIFGKRLKINSSACHFQPVVTGERGSALWAVSSASNHGAVLFSRTCFSLSRRAELAQSFSGQAKARPTKSCTRKRTGRIFGKRLKINSLACHFQPVVTGDPTADFETQCHLVLGCCLDGGAELGTLSGIGLNP